MSDTMLNVSVNGKGHLPPHLYAGVRVLKQAYDYAHDLQRDIWEYAVDFVQLRDSGFIQNDLRWLLSKGYIEQAQEVTEPGQGVREFRPESRFVFSDRSCFVLTGKGVEVAGVTVGSTFTGMTKSNGNGHPYEQEEVLLPKWDRDRHQLRLGKRVIKEFKLNSPNQEAVLMAFEEDGWPPRIDDPLVPQPESESKERLRNTIKSLNRNQINRLIRFMGDGTGEAIRWELIDENVTPQVRPA